MVDKVCLLLVVVLALFGGQGMTQAETGEYNVRHLVIESLQDSKPSYSESSNKKRLFFCQRSKMYFELPLLRTCAG